jgi:hypothetical protein
MIKGADLLDITDLIDSMEPEIRDFKRGCNAIALISENSSCVVREETAWAARRLLDQAELLELKWDALNRKMLISQNRA